jgi:hypothetical protein
MVFNRKIETADLHGNAKPLDSAVKKFGIGGKIRDHDKALTAKGD